MMKKTNSIGSWAFLIGVILSILVGITSGLNWLNLMSQLTISILVVLGILVGLLNIQVKEVTPFLMSGIALIISSVFGMSIMAAIPVVSATLAALLMIFIPATIIVAIKNVFNIAKN
jgi:hypothetical protein